MNANTRTISIVIVLILLAAPGAFAQGVGNLGSLPNLFPGVGVPVTGWSIDSGNPTYPWIPVQLDPNGPAWGKILVGDMNIGGGVVYANPGDTFTVQELLEVSPTLPWTDWHESLLSPEWDWIAPTTLLANGLPAPGLTIATTPATLATGGTIDFTFNSLPPGTLVTIQKTLRYTGLSGVPFASKVIVSEYPTPEPATLSLLALGALAILRRRGQ
ncbi:MAG: PEP-CTERM sorting domain-containing protein [Planctomycetota bacterium]|nr:PEP-CTERM sorting domain-containing protein [Planctomycetota bacterium]